MGTAIPWSTSAESSPHRSSTRRVRLPVVPAVAGDHTAVYRFLTAVLQSPSAAEFKASLEDPFYKPQDRLLIRRGNRIVAHAHLTRRVMQFGALQIPVADLEWLAVAPECRGQGLGRHLLAAAEKRMAETGALVGFLQTAIPHFFRPSGWALCGRHVFSRADARAVLARLLDEGDSGGPPGTARLAGHFAVAQRSAATRSCAALLARHAARRRQRPLHIRPWRRWELSALVRIYNQNLPELHGALQRTEAYWQWLIRRQAYDQIYVALEGPELLDLGEVRSRILGYAVLRGEQIVELLTAPDRPGVAAELIARACGDAIEHDRYCVLLHAPAHWPLHALFAQAGGLHGEQEAFCGQVCMARLLDLPNLLRRMCGAFLERAKQAFLPQTLELGLLVEGQRCQLEISPAGATVVAGRMGRSYLRLNVADFTRLVLGTLAWDDAKAQGRLESSTQLAEQAGRALFPSLSLWRPPLDTLQA